MEQHVSIRSLLLALVTTPTESKRHGAACGDVKPCCWQIAGSSATNLAGHHMQIHSACPSSTSVSCPLCVVHGERCIVYSLYQIAGQMEATDGLSKGLL